MFEKQLFILAVIYIHNSSGAINVAYDAGKELWKLYSMLNEIEINSTLTSAEVDELLTNGLHQEIKNQMKKIHGKLTQMEELIGSKLISDVITSPLSDNLLYNCIDNFALFIQSIDEYYEEFDQYLMNDTYRLNNRLHYLSQRLSVDVEGKIALIRTIMTDGGRFLDHQKNLVYGITGYTNARYTELCDSPRLISDALVQLFTTVIVAEIKANTMLAFINIYRAHVNEGWKFMNHLNRDQFARMFGNYVKTFELNLDLVEPIYLRACDPDDGLWIRDKSFHELEGTFQTTIFRYHWTKCKRDSCNNVWSNRARRCDASFYDKRTRCSDTLAECAYLNRIKACVLKDGPYKFQYVNSTELGFLGRMSECSKNNGYMIEDGTGWDYTFSACACNCYGNHNQISLLLMESRIESNKVIVGLRFFRRNKILYIQPKEGKLEANGHIHRYADRWVPIPSSATSSQVHSITKKNSVFFFDDLRLPSGYILTGVKFNEVTRGSVTGFAIEIFGVLFDYESGKLFSEAQYRISRRASDKTPGDGLSFEAINSADTTLLNKPSPDNIKYVSLKRSTLAHDFGQSTLPFFDIVPIKIDSPSPLNGIGIFHKGTEGYAGFISLRIYGIKHAESFRNFRMRYIFNDKVRFNHSEHE